jgi:hypothetical protein
MRLSLFARGFLVEPRVRQLDLISSAALQDRTLQHGASPPTMGTSNTHAKEICRKYVKLRIEVLEGSVAVLNLSKSVSAPPTSCWCLGL